MKLTRFVCALAFAAVSFSCSGGQEHSKVQDHPASPSSTEIASKVDVESDAATSTGTLDSPEELDSFTKLHPAAFIFVHTELCPASPQVLERIQGLPDPFEGHPFAVWTNHDGRGFPGTGLRDPLVSPSIVFVRNGKSEDILFGWNTTREDDFLADFISRNVGSGDRTFVEPDSFDPSAILEEIERRPWAPYNLSHLDFRDRKLDRLPGFSGSDLRGANFDGSTLTDVVFAGADLRGATFHGAQLNRVFWGKARCPDGTWSTEHGLTCELNLVP